MVQMGGRDIPLVGRCNAHDDSLGGGGALLSRVRVHLAPADDTSGMSGSSESLRFEEHKLLHAYNFRQEFT
jgi:hypothetical protein